MNYCGLWVSRYRPTVRVIHTA